MTAALENKARWLALFTLAYNLVEGLVSVWFGVSDDAIALLGFGLDSFIETGSAVLVLWRLQGGDSREKVAARSIGYLFLALAVSILAQAGLQLYRQQGPETTLPGVVISLLSLSFMFYLWRAKLTVGEALKSQTILSDAACSLACLKLSGVLLAGSAVYYLAPGLWWADSVAALILAWFIFQEGREMASGKDTCCA